VIKTKSKPRASMEPLADGQVWHMEENKLQVDMVGKLLVHYKLGKHNAVRISNSVSSKSNIEKFLKKHKATLVKAAAPAKGV
jgi:menaquinone-dependent protoporphyrinogen IX oxidase